MKKYFLLPAFLCLGLMAAADVTLVKDGRPAAEIVIADRPTLDAQYAAAEVQYHVKLITGAELPIRKRSEKALFPVKLRVGQSPETERLGFGKGRYKGEEYELKFLPDGIVMIGNECPDYRQLDLTHFQKMPRTFQPEHGTIWAAYDFLEECCGVRWYGPGEIGITYSPRRTLTVKERNIRRTPDMQCFRSIYIPNANSFSKICYAGVYDFPRTELERFSLRWRLVSRYGGANHNVTSLYLAYWRESKDPKIRKLKYFKGHHPEYFAQGYKGTGKQHLNTASKYFPDDPDLPPQPCLTHPEVFKHYAREAVDARQGKFAPGAHIGHISYSLARKMPFYYPFEQNDNHSHCQCDRCRKMFADKGDKKNSYLHFYWANSIAEEARKLDPETNICTLAYGLHQHYPHGLKLSDHLGVELVLHCGGWYQPVYRAYEKKIFDDWSADSKAGKRLVTLWTHYLSPCWEAKNVEKYNDYFPVFFYREIGRFFKTCTERRIAGWFCESPLELGYSLPTTQLELYICAMMAYNGDRDPDALIDEFFSRWYGHAAAPMRKFYETIAKASQDPKTYPAEFSDPKKFKHRHGLQYSDINWGRLGTRERMMQLEKYVEEARKSIQTPQEKTRFEIFLKGLWEPMKRGRAAYEQKQVFMSRPVPSLTVPRIPAANGDPEKADWKRAAAVEKLKTLMGFPGMPGKSFRMAHDGTYLYIRYDEKCRFADLKFAENVWSGDDVEMFFASEPNSSYLQYAVNPAGKDFAMGYFITPDAVFRRAWDFGKKSKITRTEKSFTLMHAFPLNRLLPSKPDLKPGDSFCFNLFRGQPGKNAQCWSPVFSQGFHKTNRFGKIKLAE